MYNVNINMNDKIKVKKLHIFYGFYRFCLVVFIRICVLHTALIFVWLHFSGHVYCKHVGFVFFGSLYIQVMQGCIHDDHADIINKHVMMIHVTDNI